MPLLRQRVERLRARVLSRPLHAHPQRALRVHRGHLGYAFVEALDRAAGLDPVRRLGCFSEPLRRLGRRDLEACPACGEPVTPRYEPSASEIVPCTCFDAPDFEAAAVGWELTAAGREKERLA